MPRGQMSLVDNYLPVSGSQYQGDMMDVADDVMGKNFSRIRRPYLDSRGRACVTLNAGRWTIERGERKPLLERRLVYDLLNQGYAIPITTNAAALRKDEWIELDKTVIRAARPRLNAWNDLAAANTYGGFDGMSKLSLEYEAMSDPGEAVVDMDGIVDARDDSPLFKLRSIPLPITHSDFWFSSRRLRAGRKSDTPLDSTMAEAAGRRVAESVEKVTIGVDTGAQWGPTTASDARYDNTSKVYGYTNLPQRITVTGLTVPDGTNAGNIIKDLISLREKLYSKNFFGPFVLYTTPAWDQWMDADYILTGGTVATQTLRERLQNIKGISRIQRLDYWTGATYQMVLVQMTQDVARAVIGQNITTVQWESQGGMRLNFKVMCIMVPQLRYDYNGVAAIVHGTAP